jgi:uncharacterized membrane protein
VLSYSPEAEEGFEYQFADRQRKPVLAWLAIVFAVGVVALGRARGLTAVLAVAFVELAEFSGFATEEATFLRAAAGRIDLNGLMLAGVVIGALGALDDLTVTQASAIWELRAANPEMPVRRLFPAGLRIGREHVAATVNTLFLAYAGASMAPLVLFVLAEQSLGAVANSEVVAVEIVRTLVGSVGLVASVPFTTWVAVHVVSTGGPPPRRRRPR